MTITLRPEQERLIQQAIKAGLYKSVDEAVDSALESLGKQEAAHWTLTRSQIAGQRIRELRRGLTLNGTSTRELIEDGRE